jgi:hypothetical protein
MSFETNQMIKALLKNTLFSGFSFDTSFTLRFSRGTEYYDGQKLPFEIELCLLSNWWFDNKSNWLQKVENFKLDSENEPVEPDEPTQAYELTCLRWSEGAVVKNVDIEERSISIAFENGKEITLSNKVEIDNSWMIKEAGVHEVDSNWLVVCDCDGEIFINTPIM